MADTPTRFLIVCAARTGSTWLRLMLNDHPQILCHGEFFASNPKKIVGLADEKFDLQNHKMEDLVAWRDRDPADFLYEFILDARGYNAVGAKIKYKNLDAQHLAGIFERTREDNDLAIVHLKRRNHLKRIISGRNSKKHNSASVKKGNEKPAYDKVKLNPQRVISKIDAMIADEKRFADIYKDHPMIEVYYEDLWSDRNKVLAEIQTFLGVEVHPVEEILQKLSSDNLQDLLLNYDDIKEVFMSSPYAHYFDS